MPCKWGQLPPVGERIRIRREVGDPFGGFPGLSVRLVDSGTSALALALAAAKLQCPVSKPEVILPGYACPDLIAASLWAGVSPVLVDFAPESVQLDMHALEQACTTSTVAIVAVNFLGVRDNIAKLRSVADRVGCALIEDCAQWFPPHGADLPADYTILSFGKGKPVSLLGGGALMARATTIQSQSNFNDVSDLLVMAKVLAYNVVLQPVVYGALARIPGLGIGETHYDPLRRIAAMDKERQTWLPANVAAYQARPQPIVDHLRKRLAPLRKSGLKDLTAGQPVAVKLLRYPILLPSPDQTRQAEQALICRGLGASRMYREILPEIPGVPDKELVIPAPLKHASDVASRLLTLPVHSQVTTRSAQVMVDILEQQLS